MTAAEAMIDAAATVQVWQLAGLVPADIGRQLRWPASWDAIQNYIVIELLVRDAREAPARLAA